MVRMNQRGHKTAFCSISPICYACLADLEIIQASKRGNDFQIGIVIAVKLRMNFPVNAIIIQKNANFLFNIL